MEDLSAHAPAALRSVRAETVVIIPVFVAPGSDAALAARLLEQTVRAFCRELAKPDSVCLAVDGAGSGEVAAREMADKLGVRLVVTGSNRGKLSAQRAAMRCLADDCAWRYLALVDMDGDHFANELPNLVRITRYVEKHAATERVLTIGRRISRHHPMGFVRGELEELVNRLLVDALAYDASVSGRPLSIEHCAALDDCPDLHSGYKLLTRATAEDCLLAEPDLAGVSEECYFRHAGESVITVEAVKAGARLASVNRSTVNEQPVSSFGRLDRSRLTADMIIWPCKRLGVPAGFVDQWMRNHLPRIRLGTVVPQGRDELVRVWRLVMQAYGLGVSVEQERAAFAFPPFL